LKKQKKLQKKAMVEARQAKLVYAFYSTLKQKVVKTKTYKVLAQPLRETYKLSIVRKALCALYSYGYSKYVLKVKGQRAEKVH
jgi:transposase